MVQRDSFDNLVNKVLRAVLPDCLVDQLRRARLLRKSKVLLPSAVITSRGNAYVLQAVDLVRDLVNDHQRSSLLDAHVSNLCPRQDGGCTRPEAFFRALETFTKVTTCRYNRPRRQHQSGGGRRARAKTRHKRATNAPAGAY
jgi:hypothetical protein